MKDRVGQFFNSLDLAVAVGSLRTPWRRDRPLLAWNSMCELMISRVNSSIPGRHGRSFGCSAWVSSASSFLPDLGALEWALCRQASVPAPAPPLPVSHTAVLGHLPSNLLLLLSLLKQQITRENVVFPHCAFCALFRGKVAAS